MSKGQIKRLRIFAGPNGSGKTSLVNEVKKRKVSSKKIPLGFFLNADIIEKELRETGKFSFRKVGLRVNALQWNEFISNAEKDRSVLAPVILKKLKMTDGHLCLPEKYVNSYVAMRIAEFIRFAFLERGISFSFETVMSDRSKIDFMELAKKKGYRVYLYFIATDDPIVNIDRVKSRVKKQGHNVSKDRIIKRYNKSLDLLFDAVQLTSRAYIFDNTTQIKLMTEITSGKNIELYENYPPSWLYDHFYRKVLKKKR